MKPDIEELRRKYMDNPPEGMTSMDIRRMSEDELLDMDYFLNEDELDDYFGEEGKFVMDNLTREVGTQKYVDVIKEVCSGK